MPNIENIDRLIDAIRHEEAGKRRFRFNMAVFHGLQEDTEARYVPDRPFWLAADCGTTACIGGTIELLEEREMDGVEEMAAWLGIYYFEGQELFYPYNTAPVHVGWDWITPEIAIQQLERIKAGLSVDWTAVYTKESAE